MVLAAVRVGEEPLQPRYVTWLDQFQEVDNVHQAQTNVRQPDQVCEQPITEDGPCNDFPRQTPLMVTVGIYIDRPDALQSVEEARDIAINIWTDCE